MSDKIMKNKNIFVSLLLPVAFVLLLAGCESPPEETIEERAQARWDLILENDFEKTYEYYSPGYRQTVDIYAHVMDMRNRPIRYTDALVESAECEPEICRVRVRVGYRAPGAPAGLSRVRGDRVITENWIRSNDRWWYSPPE
jgi:hypothetical protein